MRSVHRGPSRRPVDIVLTFVAIALAAPRSHAQVAAPAPPTDRWVAQTEPATLILKWKAAPGATTYRLYLASGATPDAQARVIGSAGAHVTQWIVAVRPDMVGVAQRFFVESRAGETASSTRVAFPPITPVRGKLGVLPAPASVVAAETSPGVVTLTWAPVAGATAYAIGREVFPGGFARLCPLCPSTAKYVDSTVVAGKVHSYSVTALGPEGRSHAATSNRLTPGGTTTVASNGGSGGATTPATDSAPPLINPQIPGTVTATSDTTPPPIGPAPNGTDSLATPPADTGSCVAARPAAAASPDTTETLDARAARIDLRTASNPDATTTTTTTTTLAVTTTNLGSADYRQGKCLNPGAIGYPALWDSVAAISGLTSAERVAAWKEIGVVALEYRHLLGRMPTADETRRDVAALRGGTGWRQLWRQLAHSAERDARFGYWAPAPIADSLQAQRDFGLAVPPWTSQQCFGGLGPKCAGGIPDLINGNVAPRWFGAFRMPDNTELAYVEIGVAVGSILHDNACLKDKGGLNCNGLGAGDLIKSGLWPAGLEWNKASWNVIDQRTWRARFGPYPTDPRLRDRDWYDDLRPAAPRPAMMAPAFSVFSWVGLTEKYTGGETRQTAALRAPGGTVIDISDPAFCRSGAFGSTGWVVAKAAWGACR